MAPAPLCKTAIVRFLVSEETVPKLWNLSLNMRKRIKMIMEEMEITVKEYKEEVLKIKELVKLNPKDRSINSVEDIKKGVSNYWLSSQEQLDRVVSLNTKLVCAELCFEPDPPVEVDSVVYLEVFPFQYAYFSKCSFNKVIQLTLYELSPNQIKNIISRCNQVKALKIENSSVADLDLSSLNSSSLKFKKVTFSGEVKLPSYLGYLYLHDCKNIHFLKYTEIARIQLIKITSKESYDLIKSLKGVKEANIFGHPLSEYMDYLPNTVRILGSSIRFDFDHTNLPVLKEKLPFLIKIDTLIPIEISQMLNLRSILPKISQTREKFTLRPREIRVGNWNLDQLNKHPELFERVEKVNIDTNKFNYDYLPGEIKEIHFTEFITYKDKLESLEKNNWKFEKAVVII